MFWFHRACVKKRKISLGAPASPPASWAKTVEKRRRDAGAPRRKTPILTAIRLQPELLGRLRRRFIDNAPETAELTDSIDEVVELDRLDHIGIHAQFVAFEQVTLFV